MKKQGKTAILMILCLALCLGSAGAMGEGLLPAAETTTYTVMIGGAQGVAEGDALSYQRVTELTNIKLDINVIPSDYTPKLNTQIAANNVPDISHLTQTQLQEFGASGVFLCLDDYKELLPDFYAAMEKNPDMYKFAIDGKMYSFPAVSRDDVSKAPIMFMRTDLLEKHDLAVPTDTETLYQTLKALKELYPESIPYSTRGQSSLKTVLFYMLGSGSGIYFDPDVDGGKYVYAPTSEQYKNALAYVNKLYSEGLLDVEYSVTSNAQWQENFATGKSFFSADNPIFIAAMLSTLQMDVPDAKIEYIPAITSDYGIRRFQTYSPHNYGRQWAISAKVKNPELVMAFMNWCYSEEGADCRSLGVEGVTFEVKEDGTKAIMQSVLDEHAAASDVYNTIMQTYGIAYQNFTPYLDNSLLAQTTSEQLAKWWFEEIPLDDDKDAPVVDPAFTPEEQERIAEIKADLTTMENEYFDKFIMGASSFDEWDKVVAEFESRGSVELEEIYNGAYQRYLEELK